MSTALGAVLLSLSYYTEFKENCSSGRERSGGASSQNALAGARARDGRGKISIENVEGIWYLRVFETAIGILP
jgi:hypothetical protein